MLFYKNVIFCYLKLTKIMNIRKKVKVIGVMGLMVFGITQASATGKWKKTRNFIIRKVKEHPYLVVAGCATGIGLGVSIYINSKGIHKRYPEGSREKNELYNHTKEDSLKDNESTFSDTLSLSSVSFSKLTRRNTF